MFEVIVGNIGSVYRGGDHKEALKIFREYKSQSKQNYGRAAKENVVLMEDGEPILEHHGQGFTVNKG
jgi:hypothetical protein